MKKPFLLLALIPLFVSCQPQTIIQEKIVYVSEETIAEDINPIIGYWTGESEFMLFRNDNTFVYTKVGTGWTANYEGTWEMINEKLTAKYVKHTGIDVDTYVANNTDLTIEDNSISFNDPYGGQSHKLKKIF